MPKFDKKYWNNAIFQKYMKKVPNLREDSLVKSGVLNVNNSLKTRLVDGVGGNTLIEPIKGLIDGDVVNYDGTTDIPTTSRNTYIQKKIVAGRAKGWEEKDFSTDISGEDYMPVAQEVGEYFQDVDMDDILAILKGIFSMKDTEGAKFVSKHTFDANSEMTETTINNAVQKAFGDKKKNVALAFMHSAVATQLENLQLLQYLKYTDARGITSNLEIAQVNNKTVIVDDDMPVENGYVAATANTEGAIQVGTGTGKVTLADVKKADFYPENVAADDYVVAKTRYTTYVLGRKAIEYCDVGAKVPSEVDRDPSKDGGIDKLYTRQRKLYAPAYISWNGADSIISPMPSDFANGDNWKIVNDGETAPSYINDKIIPFERIRTLG